MSTQNLPCPVLLIVWLKWAESQTNGPFAQSLKLGKKSLLESFFTASGHAQVHNFEHDYMKVFSMFYLAEIFSWFVYLVWN